MENYNIEIFYNLLQNNEFEKFFKLEKTYRNKIKNDSLGQNLINSYLINSLLKFVNNHYDKTYSSIILKTFYFQFIQHRKLTYSIPDSDFEKIVSEYILFLKLTNQSKIAYSISKNWDWLGIANNFIDEYEKNNPIEIKHSNSENIKISENTNIQNKNSTIKLFKSIQEYEFFYSITESYPNYFTYPNVALSCLVNFKELKNELNNSEIDYFFKAVIDCVVFKQDNNNFEPMFFFELDSIYHDKPEQQKKDKIKDKILSLSGQKLFRIRAQDDNYSLKRDDFKKLIKEVISNQEM